jgi:hypothetical protein
MTVEELADIMSRQPVYISTVKKMCGLSEKRATALMWAAEVLAAQKMVDWLNTIPASKAEPSWRVSLP